MVSSAGLFIVGGFFAYFVAFRYGLEFLLGLGIGKGVDPSINITEYYDLFVDVMLGVGIIFEIPVLLFLLTLITGGQPGFPGSAQPVRDPDHRDSGRGYYADGRRI